MTRTYDESDMDWLFERGQWDSWSEVLHWLEDQAEQDGTLSAARVREMIDDINVLDQSGEAFVNDGRRVFRMARQLLHTAD
jgi:hypothetical protein